MRSMMKLTLLLVANPMLRAPTPFARAQQAREVLPAPVPAQIFTGRKVFISNGGGDSNNLYNGGPDRLYNQFYAAIKNWGRYEIVGSPAEADLVLEVSLANPFIGENVPGGGQTSVSSHSMSDPQFHLVIQDPGTRVTLWVFTEHIEPALLLGNRDKNFDQAVSFLFNDLRNVAGQPGGSANNKK